MDAGVDDTLMPSARRVTFEPLLAVDLPGDVANECDGGACTADLDTRKRQRGVDPATILARNRCRP
jgi:hypothetical protein